jgi:predicted nucleic acid-binding protein
MIIVDTSVWVGTLIERDAHYAESSAWLDYCILRNVNLHFPLLIFPELAGVLARSGMSPVDTAGEISKIANRSMIRLHPLDFSSSLLAARVASTSGLKGADAVFVALAAWLDLPLVTWDRQQRERGAEFCRTMTPVEAMEVNE